MRAAAALLAALPAARCACPADAPPPACCRALTAECVSCTQCETVGQYCADHPSIRGCPPPPVTAEAAFAEFKRAHGKAYATADEEGRRFAAFRASLDRVARSGNPAHGITRFSDLSPAEFKARYFPSRPSGPARAPRPAWDGNCTACARFPELAGPAADSFDWTEKGAVTPVKDQGDCGGCWTFATTGDIEGAWFLAGNPLVPLSEQEILSCAKGEDAQGCNGGEGESAFDFVVKNGGLASEKQYPFTHKTGRCSAAKEAPPAAKISSWYQISGSDHGGKADEAAILAALPKVGPISIVVNAEPMQDYRKGVDNPRKCKGDYDHCDHSVLIVGYGTDNGVDYWKIKNSWNTDWGEKGFYRIVRGQNKCGVATDAIHSRV